MHVLWVSEPSPRLYRELKNDKYKKTLFHVQLWKEKKGKSRNRKYFI